MKIIGVQGQFALIRLDGINPANAVQIALFSLIKNEFQWNDFDSKNVCSNLLNDILTMPFFVCSTAICQC